MENPKKLPIDKSLIEELEKSADQVLIISVIEKEAATSNFLNAKYLEAEPTPQMVKDDITSTFVRAFIAMPELRKCAHAALLAVTMFEQQEQSKKPKIYT